MYKYKKTSWKNPTLVKNTKVKVMHFYYIEIQIFLLEKDINTFFNLSCD